YGANMSHQTIAALFRIPRRTVTDKIQTTLDHLRGSLTKAGVAAVVPLLSKGNLFEAVTTGHECPPGMTEKILSRINSTGAQAAKALSRRAARASRTGVGGWASIAAGGAAVLAAACAFFWTRGQ